MRNLWHLLRGPRHLAGRTPLGRGGGRALLLSERPRPPVPRDRRGPAEAPVEAGRGGTGLAPAAGGGAGPATRRGARPDDETQAPHPARGLPGVSAVVPEPPPPHGDETPPARAPGRLSHG